MAARERCSVGIMRGVSNPNRVGRQSRNGMPHAKIPTETCNTRRCSTEGCVRSADPTGSLLTSQDRNPASGSESGRSANFERMLSFTERWRNAVYSLPGSSWLLHLAHILEIAVSPTPLDFFFRSFVRFSRTSKDPSIYPSATGGDGWALPSTILSESRPKRV